MKNQYKKKYVTLIIVIIICIATVLSYINVRKNTGELTVEQKVEDFEYLYNILEENYPYFDINIRQNNIDWLGNKEMYLELIKDTKTDKEFFYVLNIILRQLNNGHTNILYNDSFENVKKLYNTDNMCREAWGNVLNDDEVLKRYDTFKKIESNNSNSKYNQDSNIETSKIITENQLAYVKYRSFDAFNVERMRD